MGVQESRARSRTTRSMLIWEIPVDILCGVDPVRVVCQPPRGRSGAAELRFPGIGAYRRSRIKGRATAGREISAIIERAGSPTSLAWAILSLVLIMTWIG